MQIFVVMGLITRTAPAPEDDDLEVAVPLVYALLTNKEATTYSVVLEEIKEAARRYRIEIIPPDRVMDVELAIKNSVSGVSPRWPVQFCFFHLGQALYRKVQKVGLQEQYNDPEDRTLKEAVHSLLALSFVPLDDLRDAYDELKETLPDELEPVKSHMEEYYVIGTTRGRGRRRQHVPPRFLPSLWNCYTATLNNSHRTNNISEGWHNKFQQVVGKRHPSFYG